MNDCKLCSFQNPKSTSTAVVIKDQRMLVVKRNQEPYMGSWDLVGGYLDAGESPEQGMRREIQEELNVGCEMQYIGNVGGKASFEGFEYPTINHFFLVQLDGDIELNNENTEFSWQPLSEITDIAFDSNKEIIKIVKEMFMMDIKRVEELMKQLDESADFDEQRLYKAIINGYMSRVYHEGELAGFGFIFPRQTALRKQAVVEDMIVDSKFRGLGLGKKVLLELLEWAKAMGCDTAELTTNPKRIAANGLYKSVGFWLHETNHYLYNFK